MRRAPMSRIFRAALVVAVLTTSVRAANVLTVDDTSVDANELDLIVPIELESDAPLTRLRLPRKG